MKHVTFLALALAIFGSSDLASANPPRRALEVAAQAAYGHAFGKSGDRSHELEARNGGTAAAVGIAYRTPYLFVPWAEAGWAALQWSRETPKAREFADAGASISSLTTAYVLLGPSVEVGAFRLRAGAGLYHLQVSSTFAGRTITPTSWDLGYFLAYGVRAHDGPRFGWGFETMALLMSESQLAYFGIALRVWGNVWAER